MAISARYWRFRAGDKSWSLTWGDYHINLYWILLYASTDCSGTALSPSGALASSEYSSTYSAAKAIDNDPSLTTFWGMAWYQSSGWLRVDCGSAVELNSFKFVRNSYAGHGVYWKKIIVEYSSDGTNFTELCTVATEDTATDKSWQSFYELQGLARKPLIPLASPLGAGRMIHTLGR